MQAQNYYAGFFEGRVILDEDESDNEWALLMSSGNFQHGVGLQTFTDGPNPVHIASREGTFDNGGFFADATHTSVWSGGNGFPNAGLPAGSLFAVCDEDSFNGSDSAPYNNGALKWYLTAAGGWIASDINRKENVNSYTGSMEKIAALGTYTYNYTLTESEVEKGDVAPEVVGIMAQELAEVIPQAVNTNVDGELFVNYSQLTAVLIGAVKELEARVAELEAELEK